MSTQNTAPDFGEPWACKASILIRDRMDFAVCEPVGEEAANRIVAAINATAGMIDPAAEIQAMRAAIREAHEAFKVSLIRAYTAGYQHGHEATVEGGFIPVHHSDETEFHAENIHQMLCDGSLPESSALAKLKPFMP